VLHSHDGYTTNLTLEDFATEDALLAYSWSGAPLAQEHGGVRCGWWYRISISGKARSSCRASKAPSVKQVRCAIYTRVWP
jgi:hypothetical protein